MLAQQHQELSDKIWAIANKLRGPYRPPQYRRVMLPMIVLRRLDCVLEPTKDELLKQFEGFKKKGLKDAALDKALAKAATKDRQQPLYNISPYTFTKLVGDPNGIARNLVAYIKGFSPKVREIFEKFEFDAEIEKLDQADRLFAVVKELEAIDLHPKRVDNLSMGYLFENLIRRFNEQANEEAGDHFTPREVIRLMAHLIYTGDEEVYRPGISRTIYDPACGTGGMLSVSEEYIREQNPQAHLTLFGQDYNPESYAICCSDMLIKDEPADNIQPFDTLDHTKSGDPFSGQTFHYMLANPPFGVEWKPQQKFVEKEHADFGFEGRFGPGLPRITDGSLLFLLHMLSKRKPSPGEGGEGSKIAIVFNGSPLFSGDAGSGESNIRRWVIENDWLDAIVALPDQLFYNTGIFTYIWLVTNRKPKHRKGKVLLIDGTRHFQKMKKSLGNKRNELSEEHIKELTRLYAEAKNNAMSRFKSNTEDMDRVCAKVFDNRDFGYLKITIERPLRLNFQASIDRIARLKDETAFVNLAASKKRKDAASIAEEEAEGRQLQENIILALARLDANKLYRSRDAFENDLDEALKASGVKVLGPVYKAILAALSERDPTAEICADAKGNPEPDPELRDTESVPLPPAISLPLPIGYEDKADISKLLGQVEAHCRAYFDKEVKPHWQDAWIDFSKTKIGYEIPINRHFYIYEAPRTLSEIERDIKQLEGEILNMLKEVA